MPPVPYAEDSVGKDLDESQFEYAYGNGGGV
jgi:hypothetical protein